MMTSSTCIYCQREKPISEFNREHVISRMFGTYNKAPVLNHYEVCKECNDYFCKELEDKVSFDSYEALLRFQYLQRSHKNTGRAIGRTRLFITGQNDIFKGLRLYISENHNNEENIQIEVAPAIGIIDDEKRNEYSYYPIDEIPEASKIIREKIKHSASPIVTFGYSEEEVSSALSAKGYDLSRANYKPNLQLSDITHEQDVLLTIKNKIDSILSRLAAKNLYNYLCYHFGKNYVLDKNYDALRSFVRYEKEDGSIIACVNSGGLKGIPGKTEGGHIIGTAWTVTDSLYLCGFVSWFGEITYSFLLNNWENKRMLQETSYIICNNLTRNIVEYNNPLIVDWPNSKYTIEVTTDYGLQIVPKKEC